MGECHDASPSGRNVVDFRGDKRPRRAIDSDGFLLEAGRMMPPRDQSKHLRHVAAKIKSRRPAHGRAAVSARDGVFRLPH